MSEFTNQLIDEPSPYLQQHAHNPVDWYPWGDEAFRKAQEEDKPVFLSIGYATCHWCHVMAHESFEDKEVAELLNKYFVNIKVDREERPDIDHIYMTICQLTTGSGGWPLTILMTPKKKPFYAATYIPKQSRFGRPGLMQLLPRIHKLWKNNRQKMVNSSEEITRALQRTADIPEGASPDKSIFDQAFQQFSEQFDAKFGGFNGPPKFPAPHNLMFLLRHGYQNRDASAVKMVEKTLVEMRKGGIFDHFGYGFHRYATDRRWLLPHFEKMLYDQAMLIMAYTEAWQMTENPLLKQTVEEIITYLKRDMRHEDGGFYSAEDADSEGEEGKFYVWSEKEIRGLLPANQAELIIDIYNFEPEGNFNEEATGKKTGSNIPYLRHLISQLAEERNMNPGKLQKELNDARETLFRHRDKRPHPLKDDKILTDWNGLTIAALAKAARVFNNEDYLAMAEKGFHFIQENLMEGDRLLHRYRNGNIAIEGHADDYAFLIWGLIELYEASFNLVYLEKALNLQTYFSTHFQDEEKGGFYFTSQQAETILQRQKEFYDGALPSANSIALYNLLRLARITGRTAYEEQADKVIKLYANQVDHTPTGFGQFLTALHFVLCGSREVVIAGNRSNTVAKQMLNLLGSEFLPNTVTLLKSHEKEEQQKLQELIPATKYHEAKNGQPTAYVCRNFQCEEPVTDLPSLREKLHIS